MGFDPLKVGSSATADLMKFSMRVVLCERAEARLSEGECQIYQLMRPHLIDLLRLYPADDDAIESLQSKAKRLIKKKGKVDTGQLLDDEISKLAIDFYKTLEENMATFPAHVQTILSPVFE